MERNEAIERIRAALKRRSGKAWSVTGGRGTAWGWIEVHAPPRRRVEHGYLSADDAAELGRLFALGKPAHAQGVSISPEARKHHVATVEDRPEQGKVYQIAGPGPSLMAGNSFAESIVDDRPVAPVIPMAGRVRGTRR